MNKQTQGIIDRTILPKLHGLILRAVLASQYQPDHTGQHVYCACAPSKAWAC